MSTTSTWISWMERALAAASPKPQRAVGTRAAVRTSSGGSGSALHRRAALAAAIGLSSAACTAHATDDGPRLANVNGSQQVVYARPSGANVVGGADAAIAGVGDDMAYSAAPGARVERPRPFARLVGGGENAEVVYVAPPAAETMTAARLGAPGGG